MSASRALLTALGMMALLGVGLFLFWAMCAWLLDLWKEGHER